MRLINPPAPPDKIKVRVLGYRIRYPANGGRGEKIPKKLAAQSWLVSGTGGSGEQKTKGLIEIN
jgi:hypothetical protein